MYYKVLFSNKDQSELSTILPEKSKSFHALTWLRSFPCNMEVEPKSH